MDREGELAIAWVASARGADVPGDTDGLDAFLDEHGYGRSDLRQRDWLAAAVLVEKGGALREYVKRTGGDLARELRASDADAMAALRGEPPTEASLRHDIRHRGHRTPV